MLRIPNLVCYAGFIDMMVVPLKLNYSKMLRVTQYTLRVCIPTKNTKIALVVTLVFFSWYE